MAVLIRPIQSADTSRIQAFFSEAHRGDPTVPSISAAEWDRFRLQGVNADGADFRVAEREGTTVGVLTSSLRETPDKPVRHFRIIVSPHARRQGVGSALLSAVAEVDGAPNEVILQSLCPSRWVHGPRFLERRGFFPVEIEWHMRLEQQPAAPPALPDGYSILRTTTASENAEALARLHNRAYQADLSFVPFSADSMRRALDGTELWLLHRVGTLSGYCHAEISDSVVWIESLVVDPDVQNRGLGTCLVATALQSTLHGARIAELQVSNPAAFHVYERLGFTCVTSSTRFRGARRDVAAALERL
jgi:ribosomal protein S18 acetylase RimI-like enzyme